MATISGTVKGFQLLQAPWSGVGARHAALLTVDFGAYTGASDDADISGVGALIAAKTRNGKSVTLRGGLCTFPGKDTANQAVYAGGAIAVSSDDLTFNLANAAGTELTSSTASTGVGVIVTYDES